MQDLISQKDKIIGTFIGLSLEDALGALYEGGFIEMILLGSQGFVIFLSKLYPNFYRLKN